ncbi:hypothetical protein [Paenibacillus elgii]|uniref:hypothetical protein n=1 Tax=Paenibacillus elgii TaxID=189691 RepID=UPI00203EC6EB|nr:hypothetical protein [Paenibacillus elgii]MCM3273158.1 hypothetical protein [Paenibacillus elgii]
MGKRRKPLPPRRLRMNRSARIDSAKRWLAEYRGGNVIRGYKNHYGADWQSAIAELRMLGVTLDDEYVREVLLSETNRIRQRKKRKLESQQAELPEVHLDGYGIIMEDEEPWESMDDIFTIFENEEVCR